MRDRYFRGLDKRPRLCYVGQGPPDDSSGKAPRTLISKAEPVDHRVRPQHADTLKPNTLRILLALTAAVVLVLATVFDWPYGYYNFLRVVVSLCSAYLAWFAATLDRFPWAIAFGVLALLFNPLLPVYLTRGIWQVLDVATAGIMIASIFALTSKGLSSLN